MTVAMPEETMGRVYSGKAESKGIQFSVHTEKMADAAARVPQVRLPRPTRYRYPIDPEVFAKLKAGAPTSEISGRDETTLFADTAVAASGMLMAAGGVPPGAPPPVTSQPNVSPQFSGIDATGWLPYDCAMAAGPQNIVCSVNSSVAAFDKSGNQLFQTTLSAWFAPVLQGANIFDPRLMFDANAQKFILATTAYNDQNQSWFLLSVSQTADATGAWWYYILDASLDGSTPTNNWADYPGLGQDDDSVYLTANMFQWGQNGTFQYAKLRIVPKALLYSGGVLTFQDIVGMQNDDGSMVFGMHPCNSMEACSNELLVNTIYPNDATSTQAKVSLWTVQAGPTLQRVTVACNAYGIPPHADQKGGAPPLDTGDARILNAIFRNGSVWSSFCTQRNWDEATNVAAIFWTEISANGTLTQQGIFGAPSLHYFYPAVVPDTAGNLTVVFSRSGASEYASLYCAGRKSADAPGSLGGSVLLKAGVAHYIGLDSATPKRNRWGDYSAVSQEPDAADADSVWLYGGYVSATNKWSTWVAKAKM